jgi:hypothetical protein
MIGFNRGAATVVDAATAKPAARRIKRGFNVGLREAIGGARFASGRWREMGGDYTFW